MFFFCLFDNILNSNGEKEGSVGMKIFSFLMVIKIAVRTIWVSRVSGNMYFGLVSTIGQLL